MHVQTLKARRRYIGFTAGWLPPRHFLPRFQSFVSTDRSGLPAFPLSDVGKGTKATDRSHFWLPRPLGGISDMLDNVHVLTLDRFLRIKNSSKSLVILFLVVFPNASLLRKRCVTDRLLSLLLHQFMKSWWCTDAPVYYLFGPPQEYNSEYWLCSRFLDSFDPCSSKHQSQRALIIKQPSMLRNLVFLIPAYSIYSILWV